MQLQNESVVTMSGLAETRDDNQSTDALLEALLGSRYRPSAEAAGLSSLYILIFFTGIVGNSSTCIVIYKNRYMHTAMNFYLLSLAISDMLTRIFGKYPKY